MLYWRARGGVLPNSGYAHVMVNRIHEQTMIGSVWVMPTYIKH